MPMNPNDFSMKVATGSTLVSDHKRDSRAVSKQRVGLLCISILFLSLLASWGGGIIAECRAITGDCRIVIS